MDRMGQRDGERSVMRFRDLPTATIGRVGEQLFAKKLRHEGDGVIASFMFSGAGDDSAPALEFHDGRIAIPDLDVARRGRRFWLEIKAYKKAIWNRTLGTLVHGIPVRLYDGYLKVERETGSPVFLGIVEIETGLMIVSDVPISQLRRYPCLCGCDSVAERCKVRRARGGSQYPQWYFRRDAFTAWFKLNGAELEHLSSEHARLIGPTVAPKQSDRNRQASFLFDEQLGGRGGLHGGSR